MKINNVYHGECSQLMQQLPNDFIDLTVTSPPYDELRSYNGYDFDYTRVIPELYRITAVGGVVVWVVADETIDGSETLTSFKHALFAKECGFRQHDTMIYHRKSLPLTNPRYEQHFEYMFVWSKGKPKTFNPIKIPCKTAGAKQKLNAIHFAETRVRNDKNGKKWTTKPTKIKGNIWAYQIGAGSADKIAHKHPAIFPEKLARDHIISWSNPGDLVFDPMCGSGTTLKMAIENGRNYLGFDQSEEYVNLSKRRLEGARRPLLVVG